MVEKTYTPVDYLNVSLPRRPRLAPWAFLVNLGDDRLQFRGAEFNFTLHNITFVEAFYEIQPLLNGNHSPEEISSSSQKKFLPTTILFLLKILRANGLLQEAQ